MFPSMLIPAPLFGLRKKQASAVDVPRLLARPDVAQYIAEREKQKERKRHAASLTMPLAALGLGAAGYGLHRLGDAALSPDDRRIVEDLTALRSRIGKPVEGNATSIADWLLPAVNKHEAYADSRNLFYDYIDRASRASKVKIFGQDVVPLMHKIKDVLGLEAPPADPRLLTALDKENLRHYPAFQEGPLPAYIHQVKKVTLDPSWDKWLFKHKGGDVYPEGSTAFQTKFDSYLADFMKQHSGALKMEDLNHGQQMDVVRGFDGWTAQKDPAFYQAKVVAEGHLSDAQRWATNAYTNGAAKALFLGQDLPRYAGLALGGIGAGVGGYWLINKLLSRNQKKPKVPGVPDDSEES